MTPAAEQDVRWHRLADADALAQTAFARICAAATQAIAARGVFRIVLAGGNTPRAIYTLLRRANTDWTRWQIYFGDERGVPREDPARNSAMAAAAWLAHVPLEYTSIHAIPAERGASAAAQAYAQTLHDIGDFDLVLLGLGEDGHTASLFPGRDWGIGADAPDTLAVFDAPKPPPQRVSLSAARLSRAHAVLFLVEGEAKRDAVTRWRAGADIPARAIAPPAGVDVLVAGDLI